jgi:hypothetical protein
MRPKPMTVSTTADKADVANEGATNEDVRAGAVDWTDEAEAIVADKVNEITPTNWSTGLKFYLDIRTGSQMHYFFFDTFVFVRNILMLLLIRVFISRSLMSLVKC